MYRPEGMKENPYKDRPDDYDYDCEDDVRSAVHREICFDVYEEGADAMLEGLKKVGTRIGFGDKLGEIKDKPNLPLDGSEFTEGGYLVFIPEE